MEVATTVSEALAQGRSLLHRGHNQEVVAILHPYLESDPDSYWLNMILGQACAALGDPGAAESRYLVAARSGDPAPVGAYYELALMGLQSGDFSRAGLLAEALALPGELEVSFPHQSHKAEYYSRIRVLKALTAIRQQDFDTAERDLEASYNFTFNRQERAFGFDWVLEAFRRAPPLPRHPHVEYLRGQHLRLGMTDSLSYEALLDGLDSPVHVLEIGAMDGVKFDPLHRHIVGKRWPAVLVEPVPDMFERLQTSYAGCDWVRCANVAISAVAGPLVIHRISADAISEANDWLMGISSALMTPELRYFVGAVEDVQVRGVTLDELIDEVGIDRIDLLQIDTEGYDWEIFKQVDLNRWNIRLLRVELVHVKPPDRLKAFEKLREAGYSMTYDGSDLTAARTC